MWMFTRLMLVVLLIATAALKFWGAAELLGSGGLLSWPPMLVMAIAFEVGAATVIAVAPRDFANKFALAVFSFLACVAGWAWWTQADCGCFGAQTPKGLPFLLDVAAVALLVVCLRRTSADPETLDSARSKHRLPLSFALATLLGVAVGGTTFWRTSDLNTVEAMPAWFGENLIGNQLPLLSDRRFAAICPEIGDALVVFLRADCDHCRELASNWEAIAAKLPNTMSVIGISVSTNAWTVMPAQISAESTNVKDGFVLQWDETEEPFIAAPTFIAVRSQIVAGVVAGSDVDTLLGQAQWWDTLFAESQE